MSATPTGSGQRPADYPHRAAPHPSVYDDFDAAMAAAALLRAQRRRRDPRPATWNAVRAYNGTGPADGVRRLRRRRDGARSRVGTGAGTHQRRGDALTWPVRGPVTLAVLRAPLMGGLPSRHRHRRAQRHADPRRRRRPRHARPAHRRLGRLRRFTCVAHTAAISTCYAHQQSVLVHPGQLVARGQRIGVSTAPAAATAPHLHFEVRVDDRPVCPAAYLAAPRSICSAGAPGP